MKICRLFTNKSHNYQPHTCIFRLLGIFTLGHKIYLRDTQLHSLYIFYILTVLHPRISSHLPFICAVMNGSNWNGQTNGEGLYQNEMSGG